MNLRSTLDRVNDLQHSRLRTFSSLHRLRHPSHQLSFESPVDNVECEVVAIL